MAAQKRKRERRKTLRNKKSTPTLGELKAMDCSWDIPFVYKLIGRMNRKPLYPKIFKLMGGDNADELSREMVSATCYDALYQVRIQSVCALTTIARKSSRQFRGTRVQGVVKDHIPNSRGLSHGSLVRNNVSSAQMRAFLSSLLFRIFPEELIGVENWSMLLNNIIHTLGDLRTRSQLFSHEQLMAGLRYDDIEWLDGIPFPVKSLVSKNLIHFLARFVSDILSVNCFITENSAMRVLFYRRDVWMKIAKQGLQLFIARGKWGVVARGNDDNTRDLCTFQLRFLPKESSVRPIVKFSYGKAVAHKLKQVKAVLDYLTAAQPRSLAFGMSALKYFHPAYRDFVLQMRGREDLCWAAGDVSNCFTSIDHAILEETLRNLLGQRAFITLNCWVTTKFKGNGKKDFWRQVYSAGPNRLEAGKQLKLRNNETVGSNPICSMLTADQVIEIVRRYVIHAHLRHRVLYRSSRGIPQGSSLSWMLSNIYLGAMERQIFEHRPRGLFCRRYVDDYIVVAESRRELVKFGKQLVRGSTAFGIRFNWEKMVASANVPGRQKGVVALRRNEKMQWCGMAFNCRTMSVTVDYKRYRSKPMFSVPILHAADKFEFICVHTKRLINNRLFAFRLCNGLWDVKRRKKLNRGFLDFCFRFYFLQFTRLLHIDLRDALVRRFFQQLVRWTSNRFLRRYLPDAVAASVL